MSKRKQSNKVLWVLFGILIVCFVLLGYGFYKYFYAGNADTKYGDRLTGIEDHPISNTLESDIKNIFEGNESVNSVTMTVEGKIIYLTIDFKNTVKSTDAQNLAIKALDPIGEANLMFYDVQFLLTSTTEVSSEENSNYPIFGAKSSSSNKVVW